MRVGGLPLASSSEIAHTLACFGFALGHSLVLTGPIMIIIISQYSGIFGIGFSLILQPSRLPLLSSEFYSTCQDGVGTVVFVDDITLCSNDSIFKPWLWLAISRVDGVDDKLAITRCETDSTSVTNRACCESMGMRMRGPGRQVGRAGW